MSEVFFPWSKFGDGEVGVYWNPENPDVFEISDDEMSFPLPTDSLPWLINRLIELNQRLA